MTKLEPDGCDGGGRGDGERKFFVVFHEQRPQFEFSVIGRGLVHQAPDIGETRVVITLGFEDFGFHGRKVSRRWGIDFAVVGVSADQADEGDAGVEVEANNEAVGVDLDFKDDPVVRLKVGGAVAGSDVSESFPVGLLRFVKPSFERLFSVGVLLPEFLKCFRETTRISDRPRFPIGNRIKLELGLGIRLAGAARGFFERRRQQD